MENDLRQAFYGVFCSSKEIIKNKQRHLYVNMLDLLGRTCRTTGLAENVIGIDSLVEFWIGELLPLVFDNDASIQTCAVSAMEQGLALLAPAKIHQSKPWPELRQMIVAEFPEKIHKLREDKNSHWHEIWCFVIQILDREILKGATIINSFLSIVELGFRSSDSNVRAEAFFCWRLLIKIFASYDELLTPKRLKLICIPLKSSQSKSMHSANVKIRVWWYFITCIGNKLADHFESVVEPFLNFVFGSASASREPNGVVSQYKSVQPIAVLCLTQLLLENHDDDFVERLVTEQNLEVLNSPSPLMDIELLTKNWQAITNATLAAVQIVCNNSDDVENYEQNQHLLSVLLSRLTSIMLNLNLAPCSKAIADGLIRFLPAVTQPLKSALCHIASNGFVMASETGDLDNYAASIEAYMALIIAGKPFAPPAIINRCIEQLNKTPQFFQGDQSQWQAICAIIKAVHSCTTDRDDYAAFELRLCCWRNLSQIILGFLRENNLNYRRKDFAETINDFILWPLRHYASFAGRCEMSCFDDDFTAAWRQLLLAGQNAPEREKFMQEIKETVNEFVVNFRKEMPLAELVDAYAAAMLKMNPGKDLINIKQVFEILQAAIALPQTAGGTKSFEKYLNTFRNVLLHLKNQELNALLDLIKTMIAQVVAITMKEKPTGAGAKFFDDWKQGILERFRTHPQKNLVTQIREVFKKNDVFVIIPSVWMLNPDKLTERQKERFAERSDIPALYNDMSQSQDSSIKAWTPKKIVIAKQNETEIVIGSSENQESVAANKTRNDEISENEKRSLRSANAKILENNEEIKQTSPSKSALSSPSKAEKEEKLPPKAASIVETPLRTRKSLRAQKLEEALKSQIQDVPSQIDTRSVLKSKQNVMTTPRDTKKIEAAQETIDSILAKSNEPITEAEGTSNQATHPSTELECAQPIIETSTEEIILETPTEIAATPPATDIIIIESESEKPAEVEIVENLQHSTATTTPLAIQEARECSPKKSTMRITALTSPPDRRSTNNTCSPSLRPKPTPHLTGRGAQLIQMIRSKMKVDSPTGTASSSSPLAASRSSIMLSRAEKRESTPVPENLFEPAPINEHTTTSTPLQSDLLTFTKRLPSPSASPSASILKRKFRESLEDTPIESPASKRKKVSFHDPPVSITKEYLKDIDENNIKPKRCLALDKPTAASVGKTFEIKHALKRRSKLDSMVEIESFASEQTDKDDLTETEMPSTSSAAISLSLPKEKQSRSESKEEESPSTLTATNISPSVALDAVVRMCPLETVLEKYFSQETSNSSRAADTLAKFMSKCMSSNAKIKTNVLEVLSENHSKDFLDHAVQENLSSVVCDRLNLNSVIEYVCAKSKLNTSCLRFLLSEIPDVLKNCKTESEHMTFIKSLLESLNPSDATILDLITMLMRIRNERQTTVQTEMESTHVTSSNL